MISLILVLVLAQPTPKTAAIATNCIATGFDASNAVLLKCDDKDKSELVIPQSEWPKEWHGPQLGWTYHLDEKGQPLSSFAEFAIQQEIRKKQLKEQRRWRRPAMQQPIEP